MAAFVIYQNDASRDVADITTIIANETSPLHTGAHEYAIQIDDRRKKWYDKKGNKNEKVQVSKRSNHD